MLYAFLCYNNEATVYSWTKEEDDAVMANLDVVHQKLVKQGRFGPALRLMPTTTGATLHKERDLVLDGGHPWKEPQGFNLHLQVVDVDKWWDRAIKAGAEARMPVQLMFWGDRYGQLRDPFGIVWGIAATPKK